MNLWTNYHIAQSVDDALQALANAPGEALVIGGGTDLLLDLQQGRHAPVHTLVDVTQIPELAALEVRNGGLFIGAGLPHRKITHSPLVQEHALGLVEACGLIGGPQVRNTATLGGNVAHALPAADGTIALMALGAQAVVASQEGLKIVPLEEIFLGPGKSALKNEVLVGFQLPLRDAGEASAFKRVMRPQGVAIAILNLGIWLRRMEDKLTEVRIAVGPSGPVPRRMAAAENLLCGQTLSPAVLQKAYESILNEASFRTSRHRATSEYRQHVVGILLEETLKVAFERAGK
jgi:CO/xanthine dehydrogenase FAD-binding subunit